MFDNNEGTTEHKDTTQFVHPSALLKKDSFVNETCLFFTSNMSASASLLCYCFNTVIINVTKLIIALSYTVTLISNALCWSPEASEPITTKNDVPMNVTRNNHCLYDSQIEM